VHNNNNNKNVFWFIFVLRGKFCTLIGVEKLKIYETNKPNVVVDLKSNSINFMLCSLICTEFEITRVYKFCALI